MRQLYEFWVRKGAGASDVTPADIDSHTPSEEFKRFRAALPPASAAQRRVVMLDALQPANRA
jgi:hypothetical protein